MSLRIKFTLSIFVALSVVMMGAGFLLSRRGSEIAIAATEQRIGLAMELTADQVDPDNYEQAGGKALIIPGTNVRRFSIRYGLKDGKPKMGELYQVKKGDSGKLVQLFVPGDVRDAGRGLRDVIFMVGVMVALLGAIISFLIANSVATPIEGLVEDVRQIARGNFHHKTKVRVGGEVAALAREIDKMAASLGDAQDTELELSAREREMEVAEEVRESLLPEGTPDVDGYDMGALQVGCASPGGDFYDVLEYEDGRIGLLVCEVSGEGVPGALIGAAARAYLSSTLLSTADVAEGLRLVNGFLNKGVRRGMYATAMYALLDPPSGRVQVACAGHKVPLLCFSARDGKVSKIQPNGFALGFDAGPVFNRTLEITELEMGPGDRLILSNTGPIRVQDPDENELGEDGFYKIVLKRVKGSSEELLGVLDGALDAYADGDDYPHDISVITIRRNA